MADVDNLKSLNDSSGHDSGDRALRLLVSVLCQAARESDVVGRLGGDEFAMLLLDTDQDAALVAATRLNEALQAVTGSDSVTASLGVSTWLGAHDSPDALLRRADEALYVAKRAGRNRAALWEPVDVRGAGGPAMAGAPPPSRRGGKRDLTTRTDPVRNWVGPAIRLVVAPTATRARQGCARSARDQPGRARRSARRAT